MSSDPEETGRRQAPEDAEEPPVPARSFEKPSLKDIAVSTGLWGLGLGWLVPALGGLTALYNVIPSHKIDWTGNIYCKIQLALTGNRWRAVVDPQVDPDRPYIFVQNHTNHYDHVMIYNATPHIKQGLELESHFKFPVYGWFMKARGTVPVRRGERGQTSQLTRRIGQEIDAGRSILAFPEGTRTRTGRVQRFRKGIFFVARDLGVPIVPVSVTGTFDMMRAGSLVIRPGNQLTVYVDAPIETAGIPDEGIADLAERARAVMAGRINAYWDEQGQKRGRS